MIPRHAEYAVFGIINCDGAKDDTQKDTAENSIASLSYSIFNFCGCV